MFDDSAHLVHSVPGRFRLKVPSRLRDGDYFERLKSLLNSLERVQEVSVNPLTSSVCIDHDGLSLQILTAVGRDNNLFILEPPTQALPPLLEELAGQVEKLTKKLPRVVPEKLDGQSALALLLLMLALRQMTQGQLLAPASTLFLTAYELIKQVKVKPDN